MKTTTERPSNAGALALAERGGPFTPAEFAMLEMLDPAERSAMRYRRVLSQPSPEAVEIAWAVEERYGEKLRAAERDLEAAIAATEAATEALFVARDALRVVERVTWIDTSGRGVRGGTAEQVEAAKAALEDAERERRTAGSLEEAARVRVSTLGTAINNYGRELAAARTRK